MKNYFKNAFKKVISSVEINNLNIEIILYLERLVKLTTTPIKQTKLN